MDENISLSLLLFKFFLGHSLGSEDLVPRLLKDLEMHSDEVCRFVGGQVGVVA